MVASLLMGQEETRAFADLLEPEPLAGGIVPEQRLIICGISWQQARQTFRAGLAKRS